MIYVLDASAIIAWLRNEPGAAVVEAAVRDVNAPCLVHGINLCEVYYDAYRNAGEPHAESVIIDLAKAGVVERNDFDQTFWKDAGKLKAGGGVVSAFPWHTRWLPEAIYLNVVKLPEIGMLIS